MIALSMEMIKALLLTKKFKLTLLNYQPCLGEPIGFFKLNGGSSSFKITQLGVDLLIQSCCLVLLCLKSGVFFPLYKNIKYAMKNKEQTIHYKRELKT